MKLLTVPICLLLVSVAYASVSSDYTPSTLSTGRLDVDQFEYLGKWELPKREAPGTGGTYTYTQGALDYVSDCMGRPDPTPDDGFPGCMLMRGHNNAKDHIGLMDIPAPGSQAQTVIPIWSTGVRELAFANFPDQFFGNLHRSFGVAYQPNPCAIWISYLPFYASTRYEDTPFIWKISCDPANPNPQGGWGLPITPDSAGRNAGHLNKYGWQFEILDQANCKAIFGLDEECLLLGSGKGAGSRESSAGPAWAGVEIPNAATIPLFQRFKPGIYYPHPVDGKAGTGRYVRFFEQSPYVYTKYHHCNRAHGGSYVRTFDGREALVQLISEPIPNPPGYYPNTPEGAAKYDSDPNTPQSTDPLGWYGIDKCNADSAQKQQPSFWDQTRDGGSPEVDCNMELVCKGGGTGPRCSLRQFWMLLYDPADVASAASGAVDHWAPQPYGKVLLTGIDPYDCQNDFVSDSTFDGSHVYVSQGAGPDPRVHVYRVAATGPPPDNECDVAVGDTCLNDPANCGDCPPCPECPEPEECHMLLVNDGNESVTITCHP